MCSCNRLNFLSKKDTIRKRLRTQTNRPPAAILDGLYVSRADADTPSRIWGLMTTPTNEILSQMGGYCVSMATVSSSVSGSFPWRYLSRKRQ